MEIQVLKNPLFMEEFESSYFPKIYAFSTSHEEQISISNPVAESGFLIFALEYNV